MPIRTLTALGWALTACWALAADPPRTIEPTTPVLSTVAVINGNVGGTGWVVDRDAKLVVTNYHVAGKANEVMVTFPIRQNGKVIADADYHAKHAAVVFGRVRFAAVNSDLALIELADIPDHTPALSLASRSGRTNERAVTVGNPGERIWVREQETVGDSLPANFDYVKQGQRISARLLTLKSGANYALQGTSGSPVVNDSGELVGVVSGGASVGQQQVRLCIDVAEVGLFLEAARRKLGEGGQQAPRQVDYLGAARLANKKGDYERAALLAGMASQLRSRNPQPLHERGVACAFLKRWEDAVADYSAALKLDGSLSRTWRSRATALFNLQRYEQAAADCTQAIKLDPKYAQAYLSRSKALAKLERNDEAQKDLAMAQQLDPSLK